MQMTRRDWLLMTVLSILWGGAFFFAAIAVKEIPPLTLVFFRVLLAAIILFIVLRATHVPLPRSAPIYGAFLVMGLLNNVVPFSLLFWAQTSISSGLASILNATTPIFSIIIAHFVLADERMSSAKVFGILLGVAGVAVLVGSNIAGGFEASTLGLIACLGAAMSYGIASVFGRRFKQMGVGVTTIAFGQLAGSSTIMLPIVFLVDQPWTLAPPSTPAILSVLLLATLSTALAYLIFFRLMASAGAVNVVLVTLLIPVSAIILGAAFLGERLEGQHFAGMALIAVGLIAIDGRLFRRHPSRKP